MPGHDDDPLDLLRRRLAADAATPLLTFYDTPTGERVELSAATFATWVAKVSHLLRDDVGLVPGDRVGLLARPHWLPLGVCAGVWAAGCTLVLDLAPGEDAELAAVAVTSLDADVLTRPPVSTAGEVLAVSTRPMAASYDEQLPPGVIDLVAEARGHSDTLVVTAPPSSASSDEGSAWVTAAQQRAETARLSPGARALVTVPAAEPAHSGGLLTRGLVRDALVVPLLLGGSAVLVCGGDEAEMDRIARTERVTAALDAA